MSAWHRSHYGDPCRECGFDWSLSLADALAFADSIPAQFAATLKASDGSEQHPDLAWSTCAYVSHVVDNFRIWAERLAAAGLGSVAPVAPYDSEALSTARAYTQLPLAGALWSLERAVPEWRAAVALAGAANAVLWHPDRGELTLSDVVLGNVHDAVHHLWDVERSVDRDRN